LIETCELCQRCYDLGRTWMSHSPDIVIQVFAILLMIFLQIYPSLVYHARLEYAIRQQLVETHVFV
jgi:hypothetical protein